MHMTSKPYKPIKGYKPIELLSSHERTKLVEEENEKKLLFEEMAIHR